MRTALGRIGFCLAAGLLVTAAWQVALSQAPPANPDRTGETGAGKKRAYDGPMNKVLLKDYEPKSNLVVPEHHPARAKFPVIDVHVHPAARTPEEVARWVKIMDDTGVEMAVLMTGASGEAFDRLVDLYLKPYPDRFMLYCGIDTHKLNIEAPDFPKKVAAELERCYRKGARGVGEVTDKGRGFGSSSTVDGPPRPRDKRLFVDDRRLDLFWEKCAELKMPVNIHIADHPSAWQPPDEHQERTPNFQNYNQYGLDVPTHAELIARFQTMIDRHPKTTFVAVHFSNLGHDLAQLGKALDRYPNLNVDLSARAYEFGRQPFTAAAFFAKYKDRILYGSDQTVSVEMWRSWWRIIETHDEFVRGPAGWWLYGLGLPDNVLEAVYRGNAQRLYNWAKPVF
jgi:predicted TIM-barrel fold metal-dependent hydrolase